MKIEPLGDSALLVRVLEEFDPEHSLDVVLRAAQEIELAAIPGIIELAPAYTTIGVFLDPMRITENESRISALDAVKLKIESAVQVALERSGTRHDEATRTIEVPVCYEEEFAPDLRVVAWSASISREEVIQLHSGASYRVNCIGFTPGFPYLSGLPRKLATPRRETPRKEIPAGAVAIGGTQTGIYPRKSPGGWNIIGRTPLRLFDVERESPALFRVGDRVRFRRVSREEYDRLST